jgi:hypothetical protein
MEPLRLELTDDQQALLLPYWKKANHHLPPDDVLIAQVLRGDFTEGARLFLSVRMVRGPIAAAMRKAARKAIDQEREKTEKRAASATDGPETDKKGRKAALRSKAGLSDNRSNTGK